MAEIVGSFDLSYRAARQLYDAVTDAAADHLGLPSVRASTRV
jgi:hypothetical protein